MIFEAGSVLDYCNMTLRLPRLSAYPPVINVADFDGVNDVHVPETGEAGLAPKVMAVRDVFPVREDTRSSQIRLEWKKGRNLVFFHLFAVFRFAFACRRKWWRWLVMISTQRNYWSIDFQ